MFGRRFVDWRTRRRASPRPEQETARGHRRPHRRRQLFLEPLEARRLLATDFGTLPIPSTAEAPPDALRVPADARAGLLANPSTAASPWLAASPPAGQAPYGATSQDTSAYMLGDVWVSVVLLESDGRNESQTENWTATEINQVKSGIQEGLTWWQDTLAAQTPAPLNGLRFHLDFTYAEVPVATGYEPIKHPHTDESLWIDSFLQQVGYYTANDRWHDMTQWDHDQRVAHHADWAYTIFVVDSSADPDGMFTDSYFAYAYVGGPYLVMTYDNDGWGIDRMGHVLAHETGHIFYGLDEYHGSGNYNDRSGYYNTQNLNAFDGNPNPSSRVASIMADGNLQDTAYAQHTSSPTSLQMLGWRDSDADGIFDVLDVAPTLTGSGSYQASAGRYEFAGTSSVQTLPNLNPDSGNAITTNTIGRLQYRLDGGSWTDGNAYSGYTVDVTQYVTADWRLHTIEVRTVVAETGLASAVWTGTFGTPDTAPPGVTGLAPPDDATQAARDANLVITFDENVRKGTGTVLLKRSSDNVTVETMAVTSAAVTVSGTTATIDPALTLGENTGYYVQFAAGVFADLAGNPFPGFTAATTWNFTTAANRAPVVVQSLGDVSVNEDAAPTVIDVAPVFDDPDLHLGDALTYTATVTLPIDSLVRQVSQTSYMTLHQDLLYTHAGDNRYLGAPEHDLAGSNISAYFASLGLQTTREPFVYGGQTYDNVVAVQPGATRPQDVYLVGAHYDSAAAGAGADDDASGTAAVLELARVLSQYQFDATLVFVAFDREEQGLIGSQAYAASHSSDHILGMLSLDMIAYNTVGTGQDTVRLYDVNGAGTIKADLAAAMTAYGGGLLTLDSGTEWGSDHYWFERGGFDAALVSEYALRDNPYYHRAGDVVESANYLDYAYATKVTRGVLGYLATAAGLRSPSNLLTTTVNGHDLILAYAANAHGLADIHVQATDALGLAVASTFRVTASSVNDAPLLDSSGALTLRTINANDTGNPGTLVRDLLAGAGGDRITDVDWGEWQGLAVTAADTTDGTWQFSLNGGGTWTTLGSPTATAARLLGSDSGTRIRFVPSLDWHGTVTAGLTFRAWDHTQGFNGQVAEASLGGGATAFSTAVGTAAVTVNSRPVFTSSATPDVPEHATAAVTLSAVDADLPAQTVGFSITGGGDAALFEIVSGELRFKTAPDFENPTDADADNVYLLNVMADDGAGGTTVQTLSVTVVEVNEPPELAAIGNRAIYPGQPLRFTAVATDPDQPADALTFSLDAAAVALGMTLDPVTGAFAWLPADVPGSGRYEVTITATDDGSPAQSVAEMFTIDVAAYNWQNPQHPGDVNADGYVTALDVLILITQINARGSRDLASAPTPSEEPPPYLDPSGDAWITPSDVLLVIACINNERAGASVGETGGEGEPVERLDAPSPVLTLDGDAAAMLAFATISSDGHRSLSAAEDVDRIVSGQSANAGAATTTRLEDGLPCGAPDGVWPKLGTGPCAGSITKLPHAALEFDQQTSELERAISAIAGDVAGSRHW